MAKRASPDNANIVATRLPAKYSEAIDRIAAVELRTRADVTRMLLIRRLDAIGAVTKD